MPADPRNRLNWQRQADAGRVPLLLIRHGQTAWNVERRFLGKANIPLDADGLAQAAQMAHWLRPIPLSGLISSPLARAWQTAEAVAATRPELALVPDASFAELDQGELEGKHGAALVHEYGAFFQQWQTDPADARVPGGETLREAQTRALAAFDAHTRDLKPGPPVALFSHKLLITTILLDVLGLPLRFYSKIGQENTAINLLSRGPDGWRLHRLNERGHLED